MSRTALPLPGSSGLFPIRGNVQLSKNGGIFLETKRLPPFCHVCRHLAPSGSACAAYEKEIPQEILSGTVLHTEPFPGDHGIRFTKATPHPTCFMTSDPPGVCLFRILPEGTCERYIPIMDAWEQDNDFIRDLLTGDFAFFEVKTAEAEHFLEQSRSRRDTINPCTLQVRQMAYLRNRKDPLHPLKESR